jgi:hypothetical protein
MTVTIGRRELLAALGGTAVAWPLAARAQQPSGPTKDFVADFGAAPAPADSAPALQSWLTFARANSGSTLTVPAGYFLINSNPGNEIGWAGFTNKCKNATIQGSTTGVTKFNRFYMGTYSNLQYTYDTAGRIETAAAGSNTITLVNSGDASKFSVGNWVLVCGLGLMRADSYPLSFQYFEYRKITTESGNRLTLDAPLAYDYKSTWPLVRSGDLHPTIDYGGPAMIYRVTHSEFFDNTSIIRNITVDPSNNGDPGVFQGCQRNYVVDGCTFIGTGNYTTFSPSNCASCRVLNTKWSGGVGEVDKLVSYLEIDHCETANTTLLFQSASVDRCVIKNAVGKFINGGTARIHEISNCNIQLFGGPSFFGNTESLTLENSTVEPAINKRCVERVDYEWTGSGVFRTPWTSSHITTAFQYAMPGFRWAIGNYQGAQPPGYIYPLPGIYPDDGSPPFSFRILDVYGDASYFYVKTDLTAPPPDTKTYSGEKWSKFHLYACKTLTLTGISSAADLSYFAEPIA